MAPSHPELGHWADGPLQLLTSPLAQDPSSKSDYVYTASEMAVVHNMILRGFNSIVLQAENVKEADVSDFCNYALCWHKLIKGHHDGEEAFLFPELERLLGEEAKGLMDGNIEQHKTFQDGLARTHTYLNKCLSKPQEFSGKELNSIMNSYGEVLREHLADEIPTLLSLEKFGDRIPLKALSEQEGKNVMGALGMTTGLIFCLLVTDTTHEAPLWENFPPIPPPLRFLLTNVMCRWNSTWWKFAPCDISGKPQRMYAVAA